MDTTDTNYYCITEDSELILLGNHGDYDAAYLTAESLGYNPVLVFEQEVANIWLARLLYFNKLQSHDHSSQVPGQVLPSNQIQ